ncbi:MAG: 4Fe-4S cluster-binding domain-containing protein [Desulfobacteraceae bacterium]|nr:4Fe-4S cluster-binding domain-containing protein [Desulfobacteraceae bacterium]
MDLIESYRNCVLCPRQCRVNRVDDCDDAHTGLCGETHQLRVAYIGPHFGEEPPISGKKGSGTIFFTGCSLKCSFCQNHQISHYGVGTGTDLEELGAKITDMVYHHHVHNINFVTPDHFFPHLFQLVSLLRREGFNLPVVYNLSGYQSVEALKSARDYVDIYLADFKYSDASLAAALSKCRDYPQIALEAIAEMVSQKGFLDSSFTDGFLATRGVLIRHLVLPGKVANSINALTTLFVEFGPDLPLSLMSQYHPVVPQKDEDLNRSVSEEEFDGVYYHAKELGFEHLFVQFPEKGTGQHRAVSPFLPDFERPDPFPPA